MILEDILTIALNGAIKTRIVYKANLNFNRARRYLLYLEDKGLIAIEKNSNGTEVYRTTEKGGRLLDLLREARGFT
jgi:predicted transcriptional regulator